MELYKVTVWDTRDSKKPEDWAMESPPVQVKALDSHNAAQIVARRADPNVRLEVAVRPARSKDMFFEDKDMGLTFQVEDTFIMKPLPVRGSY